MISITSKWSNKTQKHLNKLSKDKMFSQLDSYGRRGVDALKSATPRESGETANSWSYAVSRSRGGYKITWSNSHTNGNSNIAILLQYGHGTGTGGYVPGRDYINPAMSPVFDKIVADNWRLVKS